MISKKYCFIPDCNKKIAVYNSGLIGKNTMNINEVTPTVIFDICIDEKDKAKLFYIEEQNVEGIEEDKDFFKLNTIKAIRSTFGNNIEICNYQIIMEDESRIEFTLWFDADGNNIKITDLGDTNLNQTVLAHRYTYLFYKRY